MPEKLFTVEVFGASHGEKIGALVKGCPAGIELDIEEIQKDMDRRKPGQSSLTTQRSEDDMIHITNGIFEGKTLGPEIPIVIEIKNKDADSSKYKKEDIRPGHADLTYMLKYGHRDYRGGGFSSGRLTASMVAGGGIAKQLLKKYNIKIIAYTKAIGDIEAEKIDYNEIEKNLVRCPDKEKAKEMVAKVEEIKEQGDSIGGLIEVIAKNVPARLGGPRAYNLRGELSKAFHEMGAVTAVGFGAGSYAQYMKGSEFNDEIYTPNGKDIRFYSNNSGGIQGGITNGNDIIAQLTIRPIASIAKEQRTIKKVGDLYENTTIKIKGKHDRGSICPRAVPVAEAQMATGLVRALMAEGYRFN